MLDRGCELDDDTVLWTVRKGALDCVKLMVACGFPHEPFDMEVWGLDLTPEEARFTPGQLRCMEHLLDSGHPIKTNTLIMAARSGDSDTVRLFHTRGVPLWDGVYEE